MTAQRLRRVMARYCLRCRTPFALHVVRVDGRYLVECSACGTTRDLVGPVPVS